MSAPATNAGAIFTPRPADTSVTFAVTTSMVTTRVAPASISLSCCRDSIVSCGVLQYAITRRPSADHFGLPQVAVWSVRRFTPEPSG